MSGPDFMRAVALLPGEHRDLGTLAHDSDGIPELLARAVAALASGEAHAGPLSAEEAGWSWVLREVAERVPAVAFVEREVGRDVLILGDRELEIDQRLSRWRVGPVSDAPKPPLLERTPLGLELKVGPDVLSLLRACEVHCVTGCCGLAALQIDVPTTRPWVERVGPGTVARVITELESIVATTTGAGEIVSRDFNARWGPDAAGPFFRGLADTLRAARESSA